MADGAPQPATAIRPDWDGAPRARCFGAVDRATFEAEVAAVDEPAVLRGQYAHWPLVAAGRESPAALVRHLLAHDTGREVEAFAGDASMGGRFFYSEDLRGFNFERLRLPLARFFERLEKAGEDGEYLYAGAVRIPDVVPGLQQELDPALLDPGTDRLVSLWLGNRTRTAAHFDLPQNLACPVAGRRRFILLPIDQLPNLYVGPVDFTLAGQPISLVDFLAPDFERHPRFREALAHARVADLEPGDALYVPSMWFHHVESLDPFGAMVNFWWREAPDYMFTPMITMIHALLSLPELPERERRAWRVMFDHYIFRTGGEPMPHVPEAARGVFGEMTPERVDRLRRYLARSLLGG